MSPTHRNMRNLITLAKYYYLMYLLILLTFLQLFSGEFQICEAYIEDLVC